MKPAATRTITLGLCLLPLAACGGSSSGATTPAAETHSEAPRPPDAHDHAHHAHRNGDHGAHGPAHGQGFHHSFSDAAGWSKVFDDPARDEWQKPARIVEVMDIAPGMTVADVGAGTGYFAPHLSRAVGPTGKVIAQDVEPKMVEWLAERAKRESLPNVEALLGASDDPRLPAGSVDRVLVVNTWHHIDERPAFAKRLATALKPGGAAFVVDYTMDSPQGPPKSARLAPEAVVAELSAGGLSADVVKDPGLPYQYIVRGVR